MKKIIIPFIICLASCKSNDIVNYPWKEYGFHPGKDTLIALDSCLIITHPDFNHTDIERPLRFKKDTIKLK